MRNGGDIDVPQLGQLADVRLVAPVAHAGQIPVGPGLARVLRRRLAVHLKDAGAPPADHPAQQMQVVDLTRRGRGLVRLIEALEHGRYQPLAGADELGGRAKASGWDIADLGDPLGRIGLDRRPKLLEPERVLADVPLVDPAVHQHLAQQAVHQRLVRPAPRREVHVGLARDRRVARVHGK
jgi:hypothetical protein